MEGMKVELHLHLARGDRVSGCSGEFGFLIFSTKEWGSKRGNNLLAWGGLASLGPVLGYACEELLLWWLQTPGATGLRGLERRHLRILRGPGTMSGGPVVSFWSPIWFHVGRWTGKRLCVTFLLQLPFIETTRPGPQSPSSPSLAASAQL